MHNLPEGRNNSVCSGSGGWSWGVVVWDFSSYIFLYPRQITYILDGACTTPLSLGPPYFVPWWPGVEPWNFEVALGSFWGLPKCFDSRGGEIITWLIIYLGTYQSLKFSVKLIVAELELCPYDYERPSRSTNHKAPTLDLARNGENIIYLPGNHIRYQPFTEMVDFSRET